MSENSKQHRLNGENDEHSIQQPYDHKYALLMNINETCTDEMIALYVTLLTNFELKDGFKIQEIRRNGNKALIHFNSDVDYKIIEQKYQLFPSLAGIVTKFKKVRVPNAIIIHQLPVNCTQEILKLYFSNEKISHGGDIERIRVFQTEAKALIQFNDYLVVERVVAKEHILCDSKVKVEKFYAEIETDGFVDENVVSANFNKNSSKDKNKKILDQIKASTPFITKFLESDGEGGVDRAKLVIGNIPENINSQQLDFYLSLLTNRAEIHQVFWSYEFKGKLLVEFKRDIDLKSVFTEFNKNQLNNLNGRQLQLETVNQSKTIILLLNELPNKDWSFSASNLEISRINMDEGDIAKIPATRDLLVLYFVNSQRSGGGEIEFIERKSNKYWIIKMKDIRVVKEILSRKHFVDYKQIKTFPYYENFGLPYILERDEHLDDNLHALYKLKINDERFHYYLRVNYLLDKLNDILSETNALSKYNKTEPNTLYVIYHQKLICKIPILEKLWRVKVKEAIEYFMQVYKYEKVTLSYNQWSTILKTKQIDESLLYNDDNDDDFERQRGPNDVTISYRDTQSNIEMNVVGIANEVEKFIIRIKDIICKAYFTYELEERIINFKTYLMECEQLLEKWLNNKELDDFDDESEIDLMLASSKSNFDTKSLSGVSFSSRGLNSSRLDKNKCKTIDDFITKLEKDHLDMELSYGKLFQELGYTFLSRSVNKSNLNDTFHDDDYENDDIDDYRNFDDKVKNEMDENYLDKKSSNKSQMDKIKDSLDELKIRISDMRKKFRNYLVSIKNSRNMKSRNNTRLRSTPQSNIQDDNDEDTTIIEETIKICIYVKEQMKIITLSIDNRLQVKELKEMILKQIRGDTFKNIDDIKLTFNGVIMANDFYTIDEYSITDKCTITCEYGYE